LLATTLFASFAKKHLMLGKLKDSNQKNLPSRKSLCNKLQRKNSLSLPWHLQAWFLQ